MEGVESESRRSVVVDVLDFDYPHEYLLVGGGSGDERGARGARADVPDH